MFVCLADLAVIALSGGAGYLVVKQFYPQIVASQYASLWFIITIASLLFFMGMGCYKKLPSDFRAQLPTLFLGFSVPILLITLVLFSLKIGSDYSRSWILGWWVAGFVALTLERLVAERVRSNLVARRHLTEKYAIFGAGDNAWPMIERLKRHPGIEIVGVFDDRRKRVPSKVGGISLSGGVAELVAAAENGEIDRVVITLPITAVERIRNIVRILYPLPLQIDVGLDACQGEINFRRGSRVADSLLLEIYDRPLREWRYLVKACEDKVLASIILAIALLPLALIALAIKLDSAGPVFFRQKRQGFTGRVFEVFKFRTMYVAHTDPLGERLTERNDPRVTRIGRVLRRTSLDELPQIFNVLRGDMSLIGPRPHPLSAKAANIRYQDAVDQYALRHRVLPGITGWAQVNGWRGETKTLQQLEKRVEHDLFYVEHCSLWLDLRILAKTACAVFQTKDTF